VTFQKLPWNLRRKTSPQETLPGDLSNKQGPDATRESPWCGQDAGGYPDVCHYHLQGPLPVPAKGSTEPDQ